MKIEEMLNELAHRGIRLSLHRGRLRASGKTQNLTAELKSGLSDLKFDLMTQLGAALVPPLTLKEQLTQAINSSVQWSDLDVILEQAQKAYEGARLSVEDIDELAHASLERSRRVPESR
jgi:hypothetical protein